jgi:hypothetical protein
MLPRHRAPDRGVLLRQSLPELFPVDEHRPETVGFDPCFGIVRKKVPTALPVPPPTM